MPSLPLSLANFVQVGLTSWSLYVYLCVGVCMCELQVPAEF